MDRKKFIQLASLAALGAACNPTGAVASGKGKRVVVIGAGISGIAAAQRLRARGFEVVVLEARSRIGGRVYTNTRLGDPLDFGASWIHGPKGNPIKELANKYSITTKTTDFDSAYLFDEKGKKYDDRKAQEQYGMGQEIIRHAYRIANRQDKDVSLGWAIQQALKEGEYKVDMKYFNWMQSNEEMNYGADFMDASAWGDREKGYGGDDELFPGGYHQIIKNLAQGLDIKQGQKVIEIKHGDQKCSVVTQSTNYACDAVVVTVPLGVLKTDMIKFSPGLPDDKQKAIRDMGMGVMNKIALKFDKVFWKSDHHFICHVAEEKGRYPAMIDWNYYTGKPYLLATIPYTFSKKIENWDDKKIQDDIMKALRLHYPEAPDPIGFGFSNWSKDAYARGAYSFLPTGVKGENYDILARKVGNLHFAGEHTMRGYAATVHGAYLSGLRVGDEV